VSLTDTRLRRDLLRELVRRSVESNMVDIKVIAGIVYLTGELIPVRGVQMNLKREREEIEEAMRQFRGVRGVVNEIKIPLL